MVNYSDIAPNSNTRKLGSNNKLLIKPCQP